MTLCSNPKLTRTVRADASQTGMRFNITLVGLSRFVAFFNNDVCFLQTLVHITMTKLHPSRLVSWLPLLGMSRLNHRRILTQGFINIGDMRQLFVTHLD